MINYNNLLFLVGIAVIWSFSVNAQQQCSFERRNNVNRRSQTINGKTYVDDENGMWFSKEEFENGSSKLDEYDSALFGKQKIKFNYDASNKQFTDIETGAIVDEAIVKANSAFLNSPNITSIGGRINIKRDEVGASMSMYQYNNNCQGFSQYDSGRPMYTEVCYYINQNVNAQSSYVALDNFNVAWAAHNYNGGNSHKCGPIISNSFRRGSNQGCYNTVHSGASVAKRYCFADGYGTVYCSTCIIEL